MYQIHSIKGNIFIEKQMIYKGMNQINDCYIEGIIGLVTLMGIDILVCIIESEGIGKVKRIKKVQVLPISPNIALHLSLFPTVKSDQIDVNPLKTPNTDSQERKKSLYDIANSTLNNLQPTFKAGIQSATKLLRDTNRMVNDLTFNDVINSVCDLFSSGTFYYSDVYDLFDDHSSFVFNFNIFNNLGDLNVFGKRILQGSVQFKHFAIEDNSFELILISRRSRHRNGLRYEKRGVDELGYVANYVETVQKLSTNINEQCHLFKYSQIRGSVPLFWKQTAGLKPVPVLLPVPDVEQRAAMSVHLEKLKNNFSEVVLLSLVELQGKEGILGMAFQEFYNQLQPKIRENTKYPTLM
eukprot:NODE_617_length_5938_cov_0.189416.p2 type:complete len:353 gc:universal NODE_617_length_5938_cov_0.189416:3832-2774(-)